jgi:aminoglycoside 6-adenylyltransferase
MHQTPLTYDQIIERFIAWAQNQADIRAVVVIGSRARSVRQADQWSDLDLLVVTTDPARYLSNTDWLLPIGQPWVTFVERLTIDEGSERRVLFEGCLDVDFAFDPVDRIRRMAAEGWPPEFAGILGRGFRVILDKDGLSQLLNQNAFAQPAPCPPTADEFVNLCNDFWYHVVWTIKKLHRGELWTAKSCADSYLSGRLLRMLEWHARAMHGPDYDTWHNGRFLEAWADPKALEAVRRSFAHYDATDIRRALLEKTNLFRWVAQETAERLHYPYPSGAEHWVTAWAQDSLTASPGAAGGCDRRDRRQRSES